MNKNEQFFNTMRIKELSKIMEQAEKTPDNL